MAYVISFASQKQIKFCQRLSVYFYWLYNNCSQKNVISTTTSKTQAKCTLEPIYMLFDFYQGYQNVKKIEKN